MSKWNNQEMRARTDVVIWFVFKASLNIFASVDIYYSINSRVWRVDGNKSVFYFVLIQKTELWFALTALACSHIYEVNQLKNYIDVTCLYVTFGKRPKSGITFSPFHCFIALWRNAHCTHWSSCFIGSLRTSQFGKLVLVWGGRGRDLDINW